jgi:glycosyltransferase involved in cell wall biosynthesis
MEICQILSKKKLVNTIKNKKILIIKSRKVGLANLLNIGINNTKTEWIARADADDIYTSFFFKEGLKLIKKKKNHLIYLVVKLLNLIILIIQY